MGHPCAVHPPHQILLVCLEAKCEANRLCCLLCADERHSRHELISIHYFHNMMESSLQVNRTNPDKALILKDLNKSKADIMNRLQIIKNKLIGLVGECEDRVEQYYSKIFHSFAVDPHHLMLKDVGVHFTSEKVTSIIKMIKEFQNITLGSINDTQSVMYACLAVFKEKLSQVQGNCQAQLEALKSAWNQVSFAKPKEFLYQFSKERRQNTFLSLSDSQTSVMRTNGNGGYPMCLASTPFDPINKSVVFTIDKTDGNKKSICLGVCLQSVVRTINYANCGGGSNKGIYAIDQNSPYNTQEGMMASWNHHDPQFNQSNVGNNNIIGWTMAEGDEIRVEVDYYNSNVIFVKGNEEDWEEDDQEIKVYEMPVKLNAGPLYAFVSCQNKGDRVSIKR